MSKATKRKRSASAPAVKRPTSKSRRKATSAISVFKPVKLGKRAAVEKKKTDGSGPLEWLLPMMESAYTPLAAYGTSLQPVATAAATSLESRGGPARMAATASTVWRDVLLEYKQRKAATVAPPPMLAPRAGAVPGARNWLPLGPSVVMDGQTVGNQPVSGRVSRIAVEWGGAVVYAASANGGVFRSDDGATTWRSLMDRFDLNPTNFASASLVCGAIAVLEPNFVYVGTGEGDTLQLFRSRVTNALPSYRGVGIIRTDDGGTTWVTEESTPDLAGEGFFALACDPRSRGNVVGATTAGLYRRRILVGGEADWIQVRPGVHADVVAAASANGTTRRFFCAEWGQSGAPSKILHSDDQGATWTTTGSAFPTSGIGRIALGVQPDNPDLVYAFATTTDGALQGVYRLDGVTQGWKRVSAVPDVLPGGQGSYDLTIAVDPVDANLIYLGGDRMNAPPYGASIWRCSIQTSGAGFTITNAKNIGTRAHADVHHICHTPDEPNELWCACDGGVFLNRDPQGTGEFASQNNGLACLCSNFIAQHPTDPNILFSGLQDNGTARTASGPIWTHVNGGDGGYCLINWNNPNRVLIYANGVVYRSTTGGTSHAGWTPVWNFGWATMTQPIVGLPFTPSDPSSANLVAVGAGQLVYLSNDFAGTWQNPPLTVPGGAAAGDVFALAFASTTRLFIGTTRGQVFRADRGGNTWSVVRLDNVPAGPIGITGLITDVAVDLADAGVGSLYVAFGGQGDRRRVWHFDGARWQARSGTAAQGLLDVEHNALAVDHSAPNNVYVGADIGVWHSTDGGMNWNLLENGLPDAPVFDLQIHPSQRLLRAATHGRGVYEITLPDR